MNNARLKQDIRKAYKLCDKDYTCKPKIKASLNYVESSEILNLPIYIEQSSIMYRFFRDLAENKDGDFSQACMYISLGYNY